MRSVLVGFVILMTSCSISASAQDAPQSRFLADSPWPTAHRNPYAQASSQLRGPEPTDRLKTTFLRTGVGGSPWTVLSEAYPDGSRAAWGASLTGLFKARVSGASFNIVDTHDFGDRLLEFNGHWDLLIGRGNQVFVPDPKRRKIQRFADADPRDSGSKIKLVDEFVLPSVIKDGPTQLQMSYDGWIIYMTGNRWLGAVKPDFSAHAELDLSADIDVGASQNNFAIDERGGIFIVDFKSMQKFRWTGTGFTREWQADYDFRGPGCSGTPNRRNLAIAIARGAPCVGSGTTPTLIGPVGADGIVIVVDSHQTNNMVAFWRDRVPSDWPGLPGADHRLAAVTPLPLATLRNGGFATQNSPSVWGNDIYVSQWAGFFPSCRAPKGVQMLRWNPSSRTMPVVWQNPTVQINGVIATSGGSNLIYGSGRDGCTFTMWGLDRLTGAVKIKMPLGVWPAYSDQGNGPVVNDDRSVLLGLQNGIIRLWPEQTRLKASNDQR